MKKAITLSITLITLVTGLFAQEIDSNKSVVNFEVSNMAVNTVEGNFTGMEGTINFDSGNLESSTFSVCINASTVDTDNESRDEHLRNPDFFEVETYPEICFTSTSIRSKAGSYVAEGTLTMHGESKRVSIPFTFLNNTFTGQFEVNRFDYKIGEDTNTFSVGEDISIEIICVVK